MNLIKIISPESFVIDQFNYFGKSLYEFVKISASKTSKFYLPFFATVKQLYLLQLALKAPCDYKIFASVNNYSYEGIMKIMFTEYSH